MPTTGAYGVKKPKTLNILGAKYRVLYFKDPLEVDPDGREPLFGLCRSTLREIRICSGSSESDQHDALVHEIIHAVIDQCPLLGEIMKKIGEDDHEALVGTLATLLSDTLIRNGLSR